MTAEIQASTLTKKSRPELIQIIANRDADLKAMYEQRDTYVNQFELLTIKLSNREAELKQLALLYNEGVMEVVHLQARLEEARRTSKKLMQLLQTGK